MEIGKRIEEIREQVGLSQSALARAIGTSQSAISQIEAGKRNPSFDMLRQIAKALNVSVPHLVGADVEGLSPTELAHFRNYRGLTEEAKKELEDFAAYLRQKQSRKADPRRVDRTPNHHGELTPMKPYQYGLYSGDRLLTEIHSTEPMTDNQVRGVAVSRHRKNPTIGPRRYETPSEYEDRLRFASVRRFSPK